MSASPYRVALRLDWDAFVERDWDRIPVLFKAHAVSSPFVASEVFRAAVAAGVRARRSSPGAPGNAQVTIENMQQLSPVPWMPQRDDGSLPGYRQRMAAMLDERRYALIVNGFHSFERKLWMRQRAFFESLWQRLGLPLTGAITTLFHGSYEQTPVGVHKDRFSTFLFALQGRKRMRFWAEKPWTQPVSTMHAYRDYLSTSFLVDVEPGDLLYWPSQYYHVGESIDGSVATSVNVGVPRTEHRAVYDLEDLLADMNDASGLLDAEHRLRHLLPESRMSPTAPGARSDGRLSPSLPPALQHALDTYRHLGQARRIGARVRAVSLKRLSSGGFEPVPPPLRGMPLTREDRVSAVSLLLWSSAGGERVLCAANGYCYAIDCCGMEGRKEAVVAMLRRLNAGRAARIGDLLRPFPAGRDDDADTILADRAGMQRLLNRLHAVGAIGKS